jgi:hypothetical protein
MKAFGLRSVMPSILVILAASPAHGQLEPSRETNSPERRGEIGCSLVENKPLPGGFTWVAPRAPISS